MQLQCPTCGGSMRVPDHFHGKGRCPRCQAEVLIPAADPIALAPFEGAVRDAEGPTAPLSFAADMRGAKIPAAGGPQAPAGFAKKKKKKLKKPKTLLTRLGLPPIPNEGAVLASVGGVLALVVIAVIAIFVLRSGGAGGLSDDDWVPLEAGGCRVRFPGKPTREARTEAGISFVTYSYQPNKNSIFSVAYTDGPLPRHRLALSAEQLLNDACNGSMAKTAATGAREEKRESIELGPHPGKHMVVWVPQGEGYSLQRCYLAHDRLFIVLYAGKGVKDGQPIAEKFFGSFEILDPQNPGKSAKAGPSDPASRPASALRRLYGAMSNFEGPTGQFPAYAVPSKDRKPLLSWRVTLLPYLGGDEAKLREQFKLDEPWDGPNNSKLLDRMPAIFDTGDGPTMTRLQAIVGGGAMFEFEAGKHPRRSDVKDGQANTFLLVEAEKPVPWTKPEDVEYDPAKPLPKLGAPGRDHFHAYFVDGKVRAIPKGLGEDKIRALITRAGSEQVTPP